jgi:hypothetical protein
MPKSKSPSKKRRKRSIILSAAGTESEFLRKGGKLLGLRQSEIKGRFPRGKRAALLKGGQLVVRNKSKVKKIKPNALFNKKRRISQKISRYVNYIHKRKSYIKHVKKKSTKQKQDLFRRNFHSICNEFKHY